MAELVKCEFYGYALMVRILQHINNFISMTIFSYYNIANMCINKV